MTMQDMLRTVAKEFPASAAPTNWQDPKAKDANIDQFAAKAETALNYIAAVNASTPTTTDDQAAAAEIIGLCNNYLNSEVIGMLPCQDKDVATILGDFLIFAVQQAPALPTSTQLILVKAGLMMGALHPKTLTDQLNNWAKMNFIRLGSELQIGNALNRRFNIKGAREIVSNLAAVGSFYQSLCGESVLQELGEEVETTVSTAVRNIEQGNLGNIPPAVAQEQFVARGTEEFATRQADIKQLNDDYLLKYMQLSKIWKDLKSTGGAAQPRVGDDPK